jgi:hypothetical protein
MKYLRVQWDDKLNKGYFINFCFVLLLPAQKKNQPACPACRQAGGRQGKGQKKRCFHAQAAPIPAVFLGLRS